MKWPGFRSSECTLYSLHKTRFDAGNTRSNATWLSSKYTLEHDALNAHQLIGSFVEEGWEDMPASEKTCRRTAS